jgi:hypothetical protein
MNVGRDLSIASMAAVTATAGDLLLLLVGNAMRGDLQVDQPPAIALTAGGLLGCLSIPLYALGYAALARVMQPRAPIPARIVWIGGTVFAALGAFIHGLTWIVIRASVLAGTRSTAPLDSIAASGGTLLSAWIAAAALMLFVSFAIAWAGLAVRPRAIPVWLALLNPLSITLFIGASGAATEVGRSFIVPAAPNLAHIAFFAAAFYALSLRRK